MNLIEKGLFVDYHQFCLHLLNNEISQAAEIIYDYVIISAKNPDKLKMPVLENLKFLFTNTNKGFVHIDEFKELIRGIVKLIDSGNFRAIKHMFN